MDYKRKILLHLIKWYENSPAYTRGELPSKRRVLRLYDGGKTDMPEYDIENHSVRTDINKAVIELANWDYIGYEWMKGQHNHIISKIWLHLENIDSIYDYLKLIPKDLGVDDAIAKLALLVETSKEQWLINWAEDRIREINKKRKVGSSLPKDPIERQDLFKVLHLLSSVNEMETLERVFSFQCFGDSKRFEKTTKKRLIRIIKKYLSEDEDCSDESALRLVGLVRYPEQFEFAGSLSMSFHDGVFDYSLFPFEGIITSNDVNVGSFELNPKTKHILSIENKANFIDYVRKGKVENEVVLLHGGQFSPAKRIFLQKIISSMPTGCSFSHWGDIDYGGFSMLARLRREILPETKPYKMSVNELKMYIDFCAGFDDKYSVKLSSLLYSPNLIDFTDTIKFMLEKRVRLEQESMLT